MTKKLKSCPKCKGYLGDTWVKGRKLQQYCHNCYWKGPIRIPERLEIKTTKTIRANQFCGFHYETFDKYGHIRTSSRSYDDKSEALEKLYRELEYSGNDKDGGPYTAILWPDTVTVVGEIFKYGGEGE